MTYLIICDPSGLHCLRLIEKGISPDDITVYEDTHKGYNMCIKRGCRVTDNLEELNGMKFDIIVGNPPYGSGGNLAIAFLNKCADLSDDVRLVLPLSVRKESALNKIRLDIECVHDELLPDDTFPRGIRAVYQRWVPGTRAKIQTVTTHPDFDFVKKTDPSINVFVMRKGYAGKVLLSGWEGYEKSHYFICAKDQSVIDTLQKCEEEMREIGRMQNGIPGISKHDLITTYEKHVTV